jgi:hypothetical protein
MVSFVVVAAVSRCSRISRAPACPTCRSPFADRTLDHRFHGLQVPRGRAQLAVGVASARPFQQKNHSVGTLQEDVRTSQTATEGARYRRLARCCGKAKAQVALGNTQLKIYHTLICDVSLLRAP